MCASITDGSPLKHDEVIINGITYSNGKLNACQGEPMSLFGDNVNQSQLASHESVDFHSLQFQTDNSMMMKESASTIGRRPGSSQSFTAPINGWATIKGKFWLICGTN